MPCRGSKQHSTGLIRRSIRAILDREHPVKQHDKSTRLLYLLFVVIVSIVILLSPSPDKRFGYPPLSHVTGDVTTTWLSRYHGSNDCPLSLSPANGNYPWTVRTLPSSIVRPFLLGQTLAFFEKSASWTLILCALFVRSQLFWCFKHLFFWLYCNNNRGVENIHTSHLQTL